MDFPKDFDRAAAWRAEDLERDRGWVFALGDRDRRQFAAAVKKAYDPARDLLDYRREEFDLGDGFATIAAAAREAKSGRGIALLRGLPREDMSEGEFRLLSWAIGLQLGVARPQGKATHYLSDVRAAGMAYRSAGGRGYNTNARLDFHADTCDLVTLACFNKARAGGQSMATSSVTAWEVLAAERPDLAEVARQPFHFSRNQEEAPDEAPFYPQPLFDFADGSLFCKWNRNRVCTAQELPGVPALTAAQRETAEMLDAILQRPGLMSAMWLEPGDMQFMNNHVALHSRTACCTACGWRRPTRCGCRRAGGCISARSSPAPCAAASAATATTRPARRSSAGRRRRWGCRRRSREGGWGPWKPRASIGHGIW